MKPALTAKEWTEKRYETQALLGEATVQVDEEDDVYISPTAMGAFFRATDRHALAALLLYGQPFGFSREDVKHLRDRGSNCEWCISLADRIEALLPPEGRLQPPDLGYTQEQIDSSGVNFIREGGLWPDTPKPPED